jgi:hypothetical protein
MPTPSIVQYVQGDGSTIATFTSNVTAGNLILIIAANQGSTGVTFTGGSDNSGSNVYSPCTGASCSGSDGSGTQMSAFYCANAVGGGTWSTTWSSTGTLAAFATYCFEISGVTAYDNGGGTTGTSATAATGNFSTSFSNEIIVAATINVGSANSPGSGYTLIVITSSFQDILMYGLFGGGTQNATANLNGSQGWGIVAAAFYTPSAPPPPATSAGQIVSAAAW